MQTLHPLTPRCPKEVYPHVPTVISICLKYLTYDPNYNYDDEDEDENAMDADGVDEDYQGMRRDLFLFPVWGKEDLFSPDAYGLFRCKLQAWFVNADVCRPLLSEWKSHNINNNKPRVICPVSNTDRQQIASSSEDVRHWTSAETLCPKNQLVIRTKERVASLKAFNNGQSMKFGTFVGRTIVV